MIGICCALFALAVFGIPSLNTILVVGGIALTVAVGPWRFVIRVGSSLLLTGR